MSQLLIPSSYKCSNLSFNCSTYHPQLPVSYLVVDEQLHRVVDALEQHQLVGLPRHRVREGGPDAPLLGLQPHAGSEGVHLADLFPHQAVHVVRPHGEGEDEAVGEGRLCQRFGDTDGGDERETVREEKRGRGGDALMADLYMAYFSSNSSLSGLCAQTADTAAGSSSSVVGDDDRPP